MSHYLRLMRRRKRNPPPPTTAEYRQHVEATYALAKFLQGYDHA